MHRQDINQTKQFTNCLSFKQGMTIPAKILSIRYFTYYIIFDILPVQYYCLDGTLVLAGVGRRRAAALPHVLLQVLQWSMAICGAQLPLAALKSHLPTRVSTLPLPLTARKRARVRMRTHQVQSRIITNITP